MGAALLLLARLGMASRVGRIWWCCINLGLVRSPPHQHAPLGAC